MPESPERTLSIRVTLKSGRQFCFSYASNESREWIYRRFYECISEHVEWIEIGGRSFCLEEVACLDISEGEAEPAGEDETYLL